MGNHVIVYGAKDCAKCNALKGALHEAGVDYEERAAEQLIDPSVNVDWRTNGSVDALAELTLQGWDLSSLPVVNIGGRHIDASNLDSIDIQGRRIQITESSVHCEGGACRIQPQEAVAAVA